MLHSGEQFWVTAPKALGRTISVAEGTLREQIWGVEGTLGEQFQRAEGTLGEQFWGAGKFWENNLDVCVRTPKMKMSIPPLAMMLFYCSNLMLK